MITSGSSASARAMPMRCRCPPENSCGYLSAALAPRPTRSSSPRTRMSRSRCGLVHAPCGVRHGSAMMSPADIRAFSEAYGSWNTICTRRRNFSRSLPRRLNGSMPSKRTVPESGRSSISSVRASVDLPQPDSPTRPRVSPRPRSRSMPSSARSRFWPGRRARGTTCVRPRTSSSGRPGAQTLATSSGKWQAALRPAPTVSRVGPRGAADVAGQRAAGLVDAALGDRVQVGRDAADGLQLGRRARR